LEALKDHHLSYSPDYIVEQESNDEGGKIEMIELLSKNILLKKSSMTAFKSSRHYY